jgi:site-specific DNA-adenine methylase
MCGYTGGKFLLGKQIFQDICEVEGLWLAYHQKSELLPYFEPFLGMGGVMIHFAKEEDNRSLFGCDILEDIIEFWEAVTKQDWHPPPVEECWTREKYKELKRPNQVH